MLREQTPDIGAIARGLDEQEREHLLVACHPVVLGLEVLMCPRLAELGLLRREQPIDAWKPTALGRLVAAVLPEVT